MGAVKFENLVEMFERSVKEYGARDLFGTNKDGNWEWTTFAQVGEMVDAFRGGLSELGVKHGDNVCIISNNRVEWAVAAYACYGLGAALVPMYEAQLPKEWEFIADDCKAVAMIVANEKLYEKAKKIQDAVPSVKHLIKLYAPESDPKSFAGLLAAGKKVKLKSIQPAPKDTACLIYTSGTTGNPKGVILSHGNIASNISAVHGMLPLGGEDRSLSFLPWAHSFGHTCELHTLLSLGASMAICDSTDKLIGYLAEVKPTVLMSVPRIFNRIYDGVNKKMADKPAIIRNLFHAGMRAASKQKKGESLGVWEKLTLSLASSIVFGKIRAQFGGRLKYAFSGGAALSKDVAEFIDNLGIVVYEGYGLTETAPIATANRPGAHRIGSVGKAIPGVTIQIDKSEVAEGKQGEIVIRGPNIMMGYHNRPEENAAVFTEDRGFRTGDLGYVDDDGFLYITGRIKEQYKLENGKYVAPAPLEEQLKLSPFILNAMVYGDNRLYNVAVVVPDASTVERWAKENGVAVGSPEEMCESPKVREIVMAEVEKCSGTFKGFERVKKVALVPEDFTTDNDLLTPSLKLKRRVAMKRFGEKIEALYAEDAKKGAGAAAEAG